MISEKMKNNLVDLRSYRDKSPIVEKALSILEKWDSSETSAQWNEERSKLIPLLPELFQELTHKEPELKTRVISLLERAKLSESAFFLVRYLEDVDDEVRASAIQALGQIGENFAIIPLKNAYELATQEHRQLILKSLNQLVDDQFIFKFLGTDSNLDQLIVALEILDLLLTDKHLLLTAAGYRALFDRLVPQVRQAREAGFDLETLNETINDLQARLRHHLDKNRRSREEMKFQLKLQHTQLQNFLSRPGEADSLIEIEDATPLLERLPAPSADKEPKALPPVVQSDALPLRELIIAANRRAYLEDAERKQVNKKVKCKESFRVDSEHEKAMFQGLQVLISMANFLSVPGQAVLIEIDDALDNVVAISLNGTFSRKSIFKHFLNEHEFKLHNIPEIQARLKELEQPVKELNGAFESKLKNDRFLIKFKLSSGIKTTGNS
ncbi:MAG: HEAT repeat domain-containing protein [SAR324 cluster bacterium]|nr:HEAT repeat domain-containing protein [SAR324 cluster bacterium]